MTVHTIKQCRPDQKETEYFWKLFHAAQRNDARWHGSESSIIADELSRTDLDRNQKLFLLRAWQVLVDDKGGFGRFMGAFDTYVYNMQDPDDDCVAWKPELSKLLCDGQLLDVVIDAYQSARQRIAELEARQGKPIMFIDGDISASDAEKLAEVIREWDAEPAPVAPDAVEVREVVVKQFDDFQIVHYGATEDYAKGYIDCQNNYNKALTAAGIGVKGE